MKLHGLLGTAMESDWLYVPASGLFTMNLRLCWPKSEVLDGNWVAAQGGAG
jgi:hypothetical protein